jgi:hypothetical protein
MVNSKIMLAYPKADFAQVNLECSAAGPECQTLSQMEALIKKSHNKSSATDQRRGFWRTVGKLAAGASEGIEANRIANQQAEREKIKIKCRPSLIGDGTYNCE